MLVCSEMSDYGHGNISQKRTYAEREASCRLDQSKGAHLRREASVAALQRSRRAAAAAGAVADALRGPRSERPWCSSRLPPPPSEGNGEWLGEAKW